MDGPILCIWRDGGTGAWQVEQYPSAGYECAGYLSVPYERYASLEGRVEALESASGGPGGSGGAVNPFALSAEDGALIAGAVASVWLAAWGIRAVRSVLRDTDGN